ncbi:Yip1 family protein [Nitrosarchaeum sp.]|uniref:Yip1 family protein n=1 Tax=Nitrosarchaeum sp. TaxID=2026886 RepID=UPI00247EB6FF|nr:Yip1 family protein [Nitrosarchaeum sp.]MCV0412931.1 YIP1 family protein [Nitrosarchaeum sp.]
MKVSIIKDIIIHPKKAFVEITENEKEYFGIALIIVGIQMLVGLLEFDNIMGFLVSDTENKTIVHQFYLIISSIGGAFLMAWLVLKISKKINKTQSNFKRVFSAIQFALIPGLLIGTPIQVIALSLFSENITMENFFSSISIITVINIPFIIWSIILWIMACKQSLQLNTPNVIATAILVMIIMAVVFFPISILLTRSPFQGLF